MANLRIKLVKSLNGRHDKHIATAYSLGLHKIGNETVKEVKEAMHIYIGD